MTPMPQSPMIVVLADNTRGITKIATNISPEIKVEVTNNPDYFEQCALGKPFVIVNPSWEQTCVR